jgi:energy-coupling factor transport system permease protein
LTKLALVSLAVTAGAVLPESISVLAIFAFFLVPLAAWGRVLPTFLRSSLLLIWPFALSLFIIQGFFSPGEEILFRLGPFSLKLEGILLAANYSARILTWLSAVILLMLITRPDHLMLALAERGLPHQIGYIILTALQIIPRFQKRAQTILDAQRARGLETKGNLLQRLRALIPLTAPLILSSILELDERAIALEARGFTHKGQRTSLTELSDTTAQVVFRWIAMIAIIILIVTAAAGWLPS